MQNYVIVHGAEALCEDNWPLLQAVLQRAQAHHNVEKVEVYAATRDGTGWLEFEMRYLYRDGGRLTVGALQREPGAPFEFHS